MFVRMNYSACPYASPLQGYVQIVPDDLVAPTGVIKEKSRNKVPLLQVSAKIKAKSGYASSASNNGVVVS